MTARLGSLEDLLVHELRDLYCTEQIIIDNLPKMVDAASSPQVKKAFQQHVEQTRMQKNALDQIFQKLGQQPQQIQCKGVEGIIEEGEEILKTGGDPSVLDAALITAAQKVEHYEMAGYGSARTFAQQLGKNDVANMLQQVLNQEGETDHKLSALAEETVNPKTVK